MNRLVSVAPMMDCTDRHERYFLRLISKNILLYTEMVVDEAINRGDKKKLLEFNWKSFEEKFVYVTCEDELIIPSWAYVLLSYYLSKNCKDFVFGDIKSLEEKLYLKKISSVNVSQYKNQRVIIKGCSEIPFPEYVYFELTKRLTPFVYSLMYGEPCSTVPIFKNKN